MQAVEFQLKYAFLNPSRFRHLRFDYVSLSFFLFSLFTGGDLGVICSFRPVITYYTLRVERDVDKYCLHCNTSRRLRLRASWPCFLISSPQHNTTYYIVPFSTQPGWSDDMTPHNPAATLKINTHVFTAFFMRVLLRLERTWGPNQFFFHLVGPGPDVGFCTALDDLFYMLLLYNISSLPQYACISPPVLKFPFGGKTPP